MVPNRNSNSMKKKSGNSSPSIPMQCSPTARRKDRVPPRTIARRTRRFFPRRPKKPCYRPPKELVYATVHKTRRKGRVINIDSRTVFGTEEQVKDALVRSRCSRKVNTSFVERHNGTDRNRCSRKVRKSYCFSKDWDVHGAATCLSMYSYNFCWAVRTLRRPDGQAEKCTPAMAAELAEHVWTIREWLCLPVRQR